MGQRKAVADLKLVVRMKFGSHLYGMATSDSDIDYKGIFLPSKEEILLGRIPKCYSYSTGDGVSKNRPGDIDVETYPPLFHHLACEGRWSPCYIYPDSYCESSDIWNSLSGNAAGFTKSLTALVNYARRQAANTE
jgi:hypothetical protein